MIFSRKKIKPVQEFDLCCLREDSKEIMRNITPIGKSNLKIKKCKAFIAEDYPLSKELMRIHPVMIDGDPYCSDARSYANKSYSSYFVVHKNLLKIVSLKNPGFEFSSYNLEFFNEIKNKILNKCS